MNRYKKITRNIKKKYNEDTNQAKELEELIKKKEKYLNMIEDMSSQLENL